MLLKLLLNLEMKNSRRKFIKRTSQFTLATGLSMWSLSCDFSSKKEINQEESFLEVARIFSDNMILQRGQPIPIWGWANSNATVELFFDGKSYKAIATKNEGEWFIELPSNSKSEPLELKINQGIHEVQFQNILMGDVYLCSGQSNMEWPMGRVENAEQEIKNIRDEKIRHFKIPIGSYIQPSKNIAGGDWQICTPETIIDFTAAGYFFAKNMREKYDVPIGLVNATKGSTNIKQWMPSEALGIKNRIEILNKKVKSQRQLLHDKYLFSPNEEMTFEKKQTWITQEYSDEKWANIELPLKWGTDDFMEMVGKIWFRKVFYLDNKPSKDSTIKVSLALIDDSDISFLNGEKIGEGSRDYHNTRQYSINNSLLQKGENVFAICVENFGFFGGISGDPKEMFLEIDGEKKSLAGDWKMKIETLEFNKERLFETGFLPSGLYNSLIHPLAHFPFRAILWYQGEGDVVDDNDSLFAYRFLFEKLIVSWRELFSQPNLPFIFAQISNAHHDCLDPSDSWSARIRESQEYVLHLKNTALVSNIDSGKHKNFLHPQNKPELGRRFSLEVRKLVFGEDIIADGPVFKEMKIEGKYIYIYFSNVVKTLLLKKGNEVQELAIAGKDRKFLWAKSRVEVDRIVVWNDEIDEPNAVRYAWCDNPLDVNLYNSEGLPASPFRTDDW